MDTTGGSPLRKRNRMTFLRQNYLDQVPGVETHNRLLSADLYRLPQPTRAFCTGFLGGKYHGGEALVNHCPGMFGATQVYSCLHLSRSCSFGIFDHVFQNRIELAILYHY